MDSKEGSGRTSSSYQVQHTGASASGPPPSLDLDAALKAFRGELRDVDRGNEVERVLRAFILLPHEQLGVPLSIHDDGDEAAASAVRRAYRKASLAVHPDKCVHPRAKEAFEVLGRAQRILLADDDAGRETLADLRPVLEHAREQVRETWRKDAERDATAKLEALLHPDGLVGVQRDAEQGQEFQDAWRQRARELLTQAEWRRRTIEKRRAEEKGRLARKVEEQAAKEKASKRESKKWDKGRDQRVGDWRSFIKAKGGVPGKKPDGGSAAGARDDNRLFVRTVKSKQDFTRDGAVDD